MVTKDRKRISSPQLIEWIDSVNAFFARHKLESGHAVLNNLKHNGNKDKLWFRKLCDDIQRKRSINPLSFDSQTD